MGDSTHKETTILVSGDYRREGSARAAFMKRLRHKGRGRGHAGRGRGRVSGIPVFNTVAEAVREKGSVDASVTFVPGPGLKDAVMEAVDAGIKFIVSRWNGSLCTTSWRWLPMPRAWCATAGPRLHWNHQSGHRGGRLARGHPGVRQKGIYSPDQSGSCHKRRPVGHSTWALIRRASA